jgi:ATP-dependent Clp protease ATP-binding subunit ClpA
MARITREVRAAVLRAIEEQAPALGSPTVEAEHLLLALAADRGRPAGRLLAEVGLDPDGLRAALDHETERSLAAVGVRLADFPLPDAPGAPRRTPKLATSAKTALERAVRVASAHGDRHVAGAHLLLGVMRAELGTVPRALDAAGVDRVALATRAERLIA